MRKPRTFNHKFIYVDERQERLSQVGQRVLLGQDDISCTSLRGAFSSSRRHHRGRGFFFNIPMLLSVAVILLAVLLLIIYTR